MRYVLCLLLLLLGDVCAHAQAEADQLAQRVQEARMAGNYQEAIRLNDQEITLRRNYSAGAGVFLGNSIHTQAINYSALHDYDAAIRLEEEALALFRKAAQNKKYIGVSLNNLAVFHFSRGQAGDYALAEKYAEEAVKYEKSGTENYVNTINQLVVYHSMAGHHDKANALGKSLFKQGKKVFGLNTVKYAEILSNQSVKLAKLGNFDEAITYAEESAAIHAEASDTMNIAFAKLLISTANYYSSKEDYTTCVQKLERARAILKEVEGENGINYLNCTGELSSAYNHLGDLQKADDLAHATQTSINNESAETATLIKAQSLKKQAEVFANNGNYPVAINLQNAVLDIYTLYADSLGMANAYNTLSNYYYHNGNAEQAIECGLTSIGLYTRNKGKKSDLAQAYNSMSIYSYNSNRYDEALQYATQAVAMYETEGDTVNSLYAKALTNAALYNYTTGHVDEAINHALHAYTLQKGVLGESHPDNVTNLFNIAQYYYAKGDDQKLYEFYHKAYELQSELVRKNFSHMTTAGREMYWNTKKYVYSAAPIYAYQHENNDSLLVDTYNAQLFTKGILLNSEIDFKSLLMQSGDSILLNKYLALQKLNNQIADIYNASSHDEKQAATSTAELETLQQKSTLLERELMRNSKEYGDYTENMSISVERIAASLQEGDVAVELFEIAVDGGKAYYAMYVKKGWKTPRLVKMFSYLDLNSLKHNGRNFYQLITNKEGIDYIFSEGDVGQMVWNPLIQDWGSDVKNVYFSPSGLFYQWGIEYLLLGDGQRIGDKYHVYRLSSTKLLAQASPKESIQTATIFGGLDYDIEPELMAELHHGIKDYTDYQTPLSDTEELVAQRAIFDMDNSVADSLSLRGSVHFLPGTLKEAELINAQLAQNGISTEMYTHEMGIEENFKALSNKKQSLVHIATHGFSLHENHTGRKALSSLLGNSWSASSNDANLNFSGLLFSGANNVLNGKSLPPGVENGILTSREISMLDFHKIDMVVLSACQTGLGDIKEDGVFGLQRGLKKAGAHTLLMSLWSVDDHATQLMMTHFYTALMQGLSRHDAFITAQKKVQESGYVAPFYWASFIMLDDM